MSIQYTQFPWDTPLRVYTALRGQLNRAAEKADAGDWEEALAALDEARLGVQFLERFQRLNTAKRKAA